MFSLISQLSHEKTVSRVFTSCLDISIVDETIVTITSPSHVLRYELEVIQVLLVKSDHIVFNDYHSGALG